MLCPFCSALCGPRDTQINHHISDNIWYSLGDTKWLPDMTAPESAALLVTLEMKASKIKTKNKTKLYLPSSPSSPKG